MSEMFEYRLDQDQVKLQNQWLMDHDKECIYSNIENHGSIGGRLTHMFTRTSLGIATTVKCACGAEKNLTDYSVW